MSAKDPEYQSLLDQIAIRDLLSQYCRGVDRRDWSLVRSVFHPDAYDDHGVYRGNVDGFIAFLTERHEFVTMSMHHIGNVLVEFAGPERAMVETYCLAFQRYAPGGDAVRAAITGGKSATSSDEPMEVTMWVRYVDIMTKRDGQWKIGHRRVAWDALQARALEADGPRIGPEWLAGARDPTDLVYEQQRALTAGADK
jgi:hypothetical protein